MNSPQSNRSMPLWMPASSREWNRHTRARLWSTCRQKGRSLPWWVISKHPWSDREVQQRVEGWCGEGWCGEVRCWGVRQRDKFLSDLSTLGSQAHCSLHRVYHSPHLSFITDRRRCQRRSRPQESGDWHRHGIWYCCSQECIRYPFFRKNWFCLSETWSWRSSFDTVGVLIRCWHENSGRRYRPRSNSWHYGYICFCFFVVARNARYCYKRGPWFYLKLYCRDP